MLELKDIKKVYAAGEEEVRALRGVSIQFRESEFVAILGHSGCGKTTMLNIIGGLDQYTSGDLIINGRSTKDYSNRDWDTYRNHSVGFVFQSYHLIPHQTVLQNVELALTLSGVGKAERRQRAKEALERVGLGDQLRKRPAEMSGGQMQRVAIARAIVNNPDIILADEPTGALDSETSVQVMDILKEISRDRLVIMVTHNPELAEQYATRTIRVKDGEVMDDTRPLSETEVETLRRKDAETLEEKRRQKRPSMSFATSFGLSLRNLLTKKGRTTLTAFAGSIGIIGIALIFSVSQGTNNYIDSIQEDTLSSYPLSITAETADMSSMMMGFGNAMADTEDLPEGVVGEQRIMGEVFAQVGTNDLKSFKSYIERNHDRVDQDVNALQYTYGVVPQIYTTDVNGDLQQANPCNVMSTMMDGYSSAMMMMSTNVFSEMMDNPELLQSQYDVLAGRWPTEYNEILMVLSDENSMMDYTSYALGLRDMDELKEMSDKMEKGEEVVLTDAPLRWTYEQLMDLDLRLINAADFYRYNADYKVWEDMRGDSNYMDEVYENAEPLKVVGIVTAKAGVSAESITTNFAYLPSLTEYVIDHAADSEIVRQQLADKDVDVFSGRTFEELENDVKSELDFSGMISVDEKALEEAFSFDGLDMSSISGDIQSAFSQYLSVSEISSLVREIITEYSRDVWTQGVFKADLGDTISETIQSRISSAMESMMESFSEELSGMMGGGADGMMETMSKAFHFNMGEEELQRLMEVMMGQASSYSASGNLLSLGYADMDEPTGIYIYLVDFEAKEDFIAFLDEYNRQMEDKGMDEQVISYTDITGVLMSSVTTIIDAVTYVLIAFVAISLIVSSIMIGVITLISVQERTREIGILRAIGASKRNVSSMFNAETFIIGFISGTLGITITYLLCIPINMILHKLTKIDTLSAVLPVPVAVILVAISVCLTLFAGIIPSRSAAKKDPVVALRTE